MNLLVVSPFVPWPLDHGGKIRTFHLLRERARRHEVTLVCLSPFDAPDTGPLSDLCREVHLVPFRRRTILPLIGLLMGRGAFNTLRFRSKPLAKKLRTLTASAHFDEMQIELTLLWQHARAVRAGFKLLSAQNVEANVTSELGRTASGVRRRLYLAETRRLEGFERSAWADCDACCVVSEPDREAIRRQVESAAKVVLVPNGVDSSSFKIASDPTGREGSVLLFGGLDYGPNRDAALWFLQQVAPRLRERLPAVRVVVAGRRTAELGGVPPGLPVELRGDVTDVPGLFAVAGALAVPLRAGGGSRIKILEAMAAGLPIVASRKAIEGLAVEENAHLLIAEEPEEFVRQLEVLLRGGERVARLCGAARALVERLYDWGRIVDEMEADLDVIRARS